jgi:phosphopantetheinyl transferase (holo-ACP synthase)
MIGNDIVDLNLSKTESNWKRKGFLDKIFTPNEQRLIFESQHPEIKVWNLWSRKEAAYKIFNRSTKIRAFNPIKLECFDISINVKEMLGYVKFEDKTFFTRTYISTEYIQSVAYTEEKQKYTLTIFDIKEYRNFLKAQRISKDAFGIPSLFSQNNTPNPIISIAHHGKYCSYVETI